MSRALQLTLALTLIILAAAACAGGSGSPSPNTISGPVRAELAAPRASFDMAPAKVTPSNIRVSGGTAQVQATAPVQLQTVGPQAGGIAGSTGGGAVFRSAPTTGAPGLQGSPQLAASSTGVVRDGAHDSAYFQAIVRRGEVPRPGDLTVEGVFAQHTYALPPARADRAITLHPLLGISIDPRTNGPAAVLQLGMNASVDFSGLPRLPVNLAVVIDKSGSMTDNNKMDFVRQGLHLLLESLDESDTLSLVVYDTAARVVLPPTRVRDRDTIRVVIDAIWPSGATNLYDGMRLGFEQVAANYNPRAVNRVMLLSDGVPTVGPADADPILAGAAPWLQQGISLSTLGVGTEFNHDLLLQLARAGGGSFYYLDDLARVRTVFRDELETMLTPFAEDMTLAFKLDERVRITSSHGLPLEVGPDGLLQVHIPTAYLSRRNGAMLLELDVRDVLEANVVGTIGEIIFQYTLTGTSQHELARYPLHLPRRQRQGDDFVAFEDPSVRKNFDLLMTVYGLQDACTFYQSNQRHEAAALLDSIIDWLDGEVQDTRDTGLARELATARALRGNMRLY